MRMGGPFTSELIQFAAGTDKGKQFFFEKKNQKTFDPLGARWIQRAPQ